MRILLLRIGVQGGNAEIEEFGATWKAGIANINRRAWVANDRRARVANIDRRARIAIYRRTIVYS